MNRTIRLSGRLAIALCSALLGYKACGQPSVEIGVSVPVPAVEIRVESDFYEPLTPQGEWVVVGSYGRCWRPAHVARDWRPYCNGNWERTDAGWYWVSDEPWAWATYHYGRWDYTEEYGWYWMPQIVWAPAWVSWHEGGGYIGWAPLQPGVSISVSGFVGFDAARISPRAFVFVRPGQFLDRVSPTVVVVNNTTIIKNTVNIANTKIVNNTVINEGPATAVIEKSSGRKIQPVAVRELRHKDESAVVAKQKLQTPVHEKKVQTPDSGEPKPRGKKTDAATQEPATPAPKNHEAKSEEQKPVPAPRESKPEPNQPPAMKEPAQPKAREHVEKQDKPVRPSEKNVQRPTEEQPAARGKNEADPSDKDHGKPQKE